MDINGKTEDTDKTEDVEKRKKAIKNAGTDSLLGELGGCGLFQIILTLMFTLSFIPDTFTFRMKIFAVYNPGFKCLDNVNTSIMVNGSHSRNDSCSADWLKKECSCFDSCDNVQFNPQTKTIVSEWDLACNRHILMTTMMSVASIGGLLANFVVGYVGDKYGRKGPLIISKVLAAILNIGLALSPTWIVHAVLFCVLDFASSFNDLLMLLAMEYVPADWRVKIFALPASTLFTTMLALTAMYTEDWKILRYIAGVTGFIFIIPLMWMPKSLRWLSVNGRDDEAHAVATRIAKMNKVLPPTKERLAVMVKKNSDGKTTNTTVLDLFRKGYRIPTLSLAFISFALSFDFSVVNLVISKLPGNLYTNIIMAQAGDLPANVISYVFATRYGRRPTLFTFFLSVSVCFFGVVVMYFAIPEDQQRWPMISVVMLARMFLMNAWVFLGTVRVEVYPTVARSTVIAFCAFAGSLANFVAPFMIPKTPSTLWVSYLSMGIITFICSAVVLLLPETKDKPLKDTWVVANTTIKESILRQSQKSVRSDYHNGTV